MARFKDLCIDCADPWTLSRWWAASLGYQVRAWTDDDVAALRAQGIERIEEDPSIVIDPIDGVGPPIWFNKVPEPKSVKNRVHLDMYGDVDELSARGAIVVGQGREWTVMVDPEGNEFCVFPRNRD